MNNFVYCCGTKYIFGKKQEENVAAYIRECGGTKVLLHYYGNGLPSEEALIAKIRKCLDEAHMPYIELAGVEPNPKLSLALLGAEKIREEGIDFVLAAGGGSVIDSAKCMAVAAVYDGNVWEDLYVKGQDYPMPIPVGVILTIASTGSESSAGSVITNEKEKSKRFIFRDKNRPRFAIMDPELTYTVPPGATAYGSIDIMIHAHERYFTPAQNNYLTDMLNEAVCKTVIKYLPVVLKEPGNYEGRAQLMWAAAMAHSGIFGVGRIEDMAVHNIQQAIGGLYDSNHGAGVGCLTRGWMKFCYKKDIPRFVRYFSKVWEIDSDPLCPEDTIFRGIDKLNRFFDSVGIPQYVEQLGYREEDIEQIIKETDKTPEGLCGSFSKMTDDDIKNLLFLCSRREGVEA